MRIRAASYRVAGGPEVLEVAEWPAPVPGLEEVLVRVMVSGVNPSDWKMRRAYTPPAPQVPGQDGAGVVEALGDGVSGLAVGDRVWVWDAAWQRADGTAQELIALPQRQVVPLPDHASFELGASLGVPALTAHQALAAATRTPGPSPWER